MNSIQVGLTARENDCNTCHFNLTKKNASTRKLDLIWTRKFISYRKVKEDFGNAQKQFKQTDKQPVLITHRPMDTSDCS
jgi:hypothetical protein